MLIAHSVLQVTDLSLSFYAAAETYGRIIIREMALPLHARTIKPSDMGGVLGGTKYCVQGIMFKVASISLFLSLMYILTHLCA